MLLLAKFQFFKFSELYFLRMHLGIDAWKVLIFDYFFLNVFKVGCLESSLLLKYQFYGTSFDARYITSQRREAVDSTY